jgi:hypothetical protein
MDESALIDARPVPGTTCWIQWMMSVISAVTVTSPLVIRFFATSNTPEMRRTENPALANSMPSRSANGAKIKKRRSARATETH